MSEDIRKPSRKVLVDIEQRRQELGSESPLKRKRRLTDKGKQNKVAPEQGTSFSDIGKAFGSQAIGMLIGGLFGGEDGALAGSQFGAAAGQTLNKITAETQKRVDERSDAAFKQDVTEIQLEQADSKQRAAIADQIFDNQLNLQKEVNAQGELKESKSVVGNQTTLIDKQGNEFIRDTQGNLVSVSGKSESVSKLGQIQTEKNRESLNARSAKDRQIREKKLDIEIQKLPATEKKEFVKAFESNKVVQGANQALTQIEAAEAVLGTEGSPFKLAISGRALIKAVEKVGVITEADLRSVSGRQDFISKALRVINQESGAENIAFTKQDQADMRKVLSTLKDRNLADIEKVRGRLAQSFGAASAFTDASDLEQINRSGNPLGDEDEFADFQ